MEGDLNRNMKMIVRRNLNETLIGFVKRSLNETLIGFVKGNLLLVVVRDVPGFCAAVVPLACVAVDVCGALAVVRCIVGR